MTKNTILTIILAILILTAMGVVYLINQTSGVPPTPSTVQQDGSPARVFTLEDVFVFRSEGATEEERARFREFVRRVAKEGTTVTINEGCVSDPAVLEVKPNERVTIQNTENVERALTRTGEDAEIIILANGSVEFFLSDFVQRSIDPQGNIFRYSCDGVVRGVFYVAPEL